MEEIDLKELVQLFWEKKIQIIIIVAIFAVVGFIYTIGFVTPKYQATTSLLLATNSAQSAAGLDSSITTNDVNLNSKLVSTYSKLVKSDKVVITVISNLTLKKIVSVTAAEDTEFIEISVKDEDPALATKIANEIAKVFIDNVKEFYGVENVHVVDAAEVPQAPYNINHAKDIVIFAFIGVVVAVMNVLIVNMLDTTIKSEEDIEKNFGLTVLATMPLYEDEDNKRKGKKRK